MSVRNLQEEQKWVNEFYQKQGKAPSTAEDWKKIHEASYGKDLPADLAALPMYSTGVKASTNAGANVGSTEKPLMYQGEDISNSALATARSNYGEVNNAPTFLEQIKKRMAEQFQPESAVLSIDPISASLGALNPSQLMKGLELQSQSVRRKGALALDALSTATTMYSTLAATAKDKLVGLEKKRADYETEQKSTETELKAIALEVAKAGNAVPKELLDLLPQNLRSVYENLHTVLKEKVTDYGLGNLFGGGGSSTGGVVTTATGDAYDIGSYATDPNHEKAVQNFLNNIGQFKTTTDIDNYIQQNAPDSPITGEMIKNSADKYGVSWEMMAAIMQQDSSLGTKGKAVRTFNPGNVGNTDSGAEVNYGSWQAGVDAVAKNLAGRKTTATTATQESIPAFDNIIDLSPAEQMARLKAMVGDDKTGEKLARAVKQFDEYKASKTPTDPTADAKSLAKQIFDGTSSLNITSLPTAKREEVDKELAALKQEAKASGTIEGLIKSSAGGKEVGDTFIQSFDKALNTIAQVSDLQETFKDDKKMKKNYGFDINPIANIWRSKNPYDTKAKQIAAQLSAIVPNLARGIYGEVGVLTDNDIKIYSQTLPSLGSTDDVRKAVLGITVKSIQRSIENKLKSQAGGGRDVSGYLSQYKEVSAMADRLLADAGIGNASWNVEPTNFKDLSQFEQ